MKQNPDLQTQRTKVLLVVILAIFVDMLMYGLVVPFLPIYASTLGASQAEIGLLFSAYAITLFIATPIFGAVADRIGRKKLLVFGLIGLTVTTLLFAFAQTFAVLVAARALQGLAAAIPWSAGLALLADTFPSEERGKAMGMAMSGQAGGVLLGPPLGGWLYELGGYQLPFFIASGMTLLVAVLTILLLKRVPETKAQSFTSPFQVLRHKQLLLIAGVAVVGAAVFASVEPTLPLHFDQNLNISPGAIGLLFVVMTFVYGLSSPFIGAIAGRLGYEKMMMIGLILVAIALPLNTLPTTISMQVLTLALLGFSLVLILTPALPKLADLAQAAGVTALGVTYATYNTAYSFGMMIGPLLASTFAQYFGLRIAYLLLGGLFLLYIIPLSRLKGGRT